MFKRLKYEQGYKDRVQGKSPRYPLKAGVSRGDRSASGPLVFDAPPPPAALGSTTETPQDPPVVVATVGPSAKLSFGAAEASHLDIASV